MSLSTLSLPTNWSFALCSISITCASLMWLRRRAIIDTLTRSPVSADMELRSDTKMGLSLPSGINEFLPFDFLTNRPSCTCPLVLSLYELSLTLVMASSHDISSMMSMASIFNGCVLRRSEWNISLRVRVLSGCELKNASRTLASCFFVMRLPPRRSFLD